MNSHRGTLIIKPKKKAHPIPQEILVLLTDAFEKIPTHARAIICAHHKLKVFLYTDDDSTFPGDGCHGLCDWEKVIHIKMGGPDIVFTFAHEVAHLYLWSIGGWAASYIDETPWRLKDRIKDALNVFRGHVGFGDEVISDAHERLTDCIAISWGFFPKDGSYLGEESVQNIQDSFNGSERVSCKSDGKRVARNRSSSRSASNT